MSENTFSTDRLESADRLENPYSLDEDVEISPISDFVETYEKEDDINGEEWVLSGRIVRENEFGDFVFYDLSDREDKVQVMCSVDERSNFETDNYDDLKHVNIGDRLVFTGHPEFSDTGELTLNAERFSVSSKALQDISKSHNQFGESKKITDRTGAISTDDELFDNIQTRFDVMECVREYLNQSGFKEVQTPILQNESGGADATTFSTYAESIDRKMYLRISPELYLKRLITAGFSSVFEVAKCFRNEDIDTTHNPEFTLLELYKTYTDYKDMMELTEELYSYVSAEVRGESTVELNCREIDVKPPWNRFTFDELIENEVGRPVDSVSCSYIRSDLSDNYGLNQSRLESMSRDDLLMLLFDKRVEDSLIEPTIVSKYPKGSTPLCQTCEDNDSRLQRFEAFVGGFEVANAYTELTDARRQRQRFMQQSDDINEDFVEAVSYGMPPAGGLGIGIDRMCMLISGCESIKQVLPFPLANSRI